MEFCGSSMASTKSEIKGNLVWTEVYGLVHGMETQILRSAKDDGEQYL